MDVDCIVDIERIADCLYSDECAHIVASSLAERRRKLAVLAKRNLKTCKHLDPFKVIDDEARFICEALDDAVVTFPQSLRVATTYRTMYHYPWKKLDFFQLFFNNGFLNLSSRNYIGLSPVMSYLSSPHRPMDYDYNLEFVKWLCEQGYLDQKPRDPLGLGYNLHATGWHYLAEDLAYDWNTDLQSTQLSSLFLLEEDEQFQLRNTDECVCWCNLDGKGCLPSKTLWKKALPPYRPILCTIYKQRRRQEYWAGILRKYMSRREPHLQSSLEFTRLLTFETLGMTHTCCFRKEVDLNQIRKQQIHQCNIPPAYAIILLFNRDQGHVRKVRSNDLELKDALLLDALMAEFAAEMKASSSSPTRTLGDFIWGYWRRRISKTFVVNSEAVDEMKLLVEKFDTCKQSDWKFVTILTSL